MTNPNLTLSTKWMTYLRPDHSIHEWYNKLKGLTRHPNFQFCYRRIKCGYHPKFSDEPPDLGPFPQRHTEVSSSTSQDVSDSSHVPWSFGLDKWLIFSAWTISIGIDIFAIWFLQRCALLNAGFTFVLRYNRSCIRLYDPPSFVDPEGLFLNRPFGVLGITHPTSLLSDCESGPRHWWRSLYTDRIKLSQRSRGLLFAKLNVCLNRKKSRFQSCTVKTISLNGSVGLCGLNG